MTTRCNCVFCITPPHVLRKLLESRNKEIRQAALNTLLLTERMRGERGRRSVVQGVAPAAGRRTVYDCQNREAIPSAVLARTEDGPPSSDQSVNRAFDGLGATREFYKNVLERNSIDDSGMRLDAYVHRGTRYNNAFWNSSEMVFGDGDGILFNDFTNSLDVIGHELTHGVTEFTAGLEYQNQSGALNESMSDVFGSLVKQWSLKLTANQADWLIGAEVFTPSVGGDALRSMKAPGTAYDNVELGKDPQPDHMSKFVVLPNTAEGDWGGVHINSGIPNKAFYLVATAIGGNAWDAPGIIWYESLRASSHDTQFQQFADTTFAMSGQRYGTGSNEQLAVTMAWAEVGVPVSDTKIADKAGPAPDDDPMVKLAAQLASIADNMHAIAREMAALKGKR